MSTFDKLNYQMLRDSAPVMIGTSSREALGVQLGAHGATSPSSVAWQTANRATFIPFVIASWVTVKKLWAMNGSAVSGNIDIGIYDENGTRLVSTGSTPQTGTNATQEFDVTDTYLKPGKYYLAVVLDNITGAFLTWTALTSFPLWGVAVQTSAFPLAATATLAASSTVNLPMVGLSQRTLVA